MMSNSRNNHPAFLMRIARGSTLQGFLIVSGVVLFVVASFHLLLAVLTEPLILNRFSQPTQLRLINPLAAGLAFAKPVVWAWALVVSISAAIRRYVSPRVKSRESQNEGR